MNEMISLENTRFTECVRTHDSGSVFLGYLYGTLVVEGVLDGEDLKIGMPDLQVRITAEAKPWVDFPSDVKEIRGENRRVSRYHTANPASRDALTKLVFAQPAVRRALNRAAAEIEAA